MSDGPVGRDRPARDEVPVDPALPSRSRGVIALDPDACTSCMVCARECPDWCIHITSHTETYAVEGSARPRQRQVLDRFAIDYALCLWCGICIEVCPFDALRWAPDHDYAAFDVRDLVHERERLAGWLPAPAGDAGGPTGSW